ncbi:MAG: hypothetical protein N2555_05555 [Endomicrobia bacterium]|nr:hypothetical protein [Endomicrobiia bacterium]
MEINYTQFNLNIKNIVSKHKVFFFHGENTFYMFETINKFINDSYNIETLYPWETDMNEVVKKLATNDLFTVYNCLILRYFNIAKKNFRKQLKEFLQSYKVENYFFILYEQQLTERERTEEVIKYLIDEHIAVEFTNLTKTEIINEFIPLKTKLVLSEEAKELLCEKTNNDLWLLTNELEKLNYYANGKTEITEDDVLNCCGEYEVSEVSQLTDGIISNNLGENLRILQELIDVKKTSEVYILNTIYWFFRRRMFKKISEQKMSKILQELQKTDYKLKTSPFKKYILETFIVRITQILND